MLNIKGLTVSYQTQSNSISVIKDINLKVKEGTTCAIIGPSGCGKTTLLNVLAGLKEPDQGDIQFKGDPITGERKDIALILQGYGLLPWKTVRENVALGFKIRRVKSRQYEGQIDDLLTELEIKSFANNYPRQLSGGQRQRVAIARALTLKPDLLLMDEPFSSLDALTREQMQNLFLLLWQKYRMTSVLVTHSIEEAAFLGHKIVVFSGVSGKILEQIKNQHFGREDWRSSSSFYQQCQQLRSLLKEGSEV